MTVLAQLNLDDGSWNVEEDFEERTSTVIYMVGLTSSSLPANISGFSVRLVATRGAETLVDKLHPAEGVVWETADQDWLFMEPIEASFDDEIMVRLIATKDGVENSNEHTFTILRPQKPFESWVWNGIEEWTAPTPYPGDNTSFYNWDEETTSWVLDPDA